MQFAALAAHLVFFTGLKAGGWHLFNGCGLHNNKMLD
ncbi:hypothetical protein WGH24286_00793 [Periweissella ghanensis]|uniref:Uncharacterized protein n=1 Tax=Periweissella ghanensis TaxID=467997 RepID=A0ABM8ZBW9_9LACO|nr:hypothetical protein WGH24286_00793 [Periweissella ghanensis]